MFVLGSDFGDGRTPSTRLGPTGCELSEWKSATSITCKTGRSSGTGQNAVKISVINADTKTIGELTNQVSYDAPTLIGMAGRNIPRSGSVSVTVVGGGGLGGSGGSARVRIGLSACGGSVWVSDSGVVCRGASGG